MSPRTYIPILAVIFAAGWFAIWLHNRDVRNRELGAAQARIARDSALVVSMRDSLLARGRGTDSAIVKVDTLIKTFDRWRTRVERIPGVPDTVKVPVRFVESADSLRQACGLLQENCQRFKLFADSTIEAQRRIISSQRVSFESKPGGRRWGVGAFGGVCEDRKPCAGVGLVLRVF